MTYLDNEAFFAYNVLLNREQFFWFSCYQLNIANLYFYKELLWRSPLIHGALLNDIIANMMRWLTISLRNIICRSVWAFLLASLPSAIILLAIWVYYAFHFSHTDLLKTGDRREKKQTLEVEGKLNPLQAHRTSRSLLQQLQRQQLEGGLLEDEY